MNFQAILCLSFIVVTTQLSLRTDEDEADPDPQGIMDFEGILTGVFGMHDALMKQFELKEQFELKQQEEKDAGMLIGGRGQEVHAAHENELLDVHTTTTGGTGGPTMSPTEVPTMAPTPSPPTPKPTTWHPGRAGDTNDFNERKWPREAWKSPLGPGDNYPGKSNWQLDTTTQCTQSDVKELNYWALKQAKKRLPTSGYDGPNFDGNCFKYFFNGWALNVSAYATCFQKFYSVSTPCAQCVGKVYNMAFFNWSQPCYNFCKGRPNRRDGAHWCWEDCQSCMWYIGKQLTTCYGEPYDMMCRYARELGKEEWFEQNGINPKR